MRDPPTVPWPARAAAASPALARPLVLVAGRLRRRQSHAAARGPGPPRPGRRVQRRRGRSGTVQTIAARPHVAGSAANDRVREYLLTTLRGLGLRPEVQDTVRCRAASCPSSAGGIGMARVRNVVARLPGTASTGRIFLVAHYDSVQVGSGGNDDGAGVATAAGDRPRPDRRPAAAQRHRASCSPTPRRRACAAPRRSSSQHPLARGGGVVLNFEARGSSGPAIMFETSAGNADAGRRRTAAVPDPVGTSFAVEVYRLLPNDTDFTPFRAGRLHRPQHAPTSTARRSTTARATGRPTMDKASLQHHGDNALALARAFGGRRPGARCAAVGGDATYFPVLGLLVRYPGWLVWPLAGARAAGRAGAGVGWPAAAAWSPAGAAGRRLRLALRAARRWRRSLAQLLWTLLVTLIRPGYANMIDPCRPRLVPAGRASRSSRPFCWPGTRLLRRRLGPAALAIGGARPAGRARRACWPRSRPAARTWPRCPRWPARSPASSRSCPRRRGSVVAVLAVAAGGAVGARAAADGAAVLPGAGPGHRPAAAAFVAVMLGLALLPVIDCVHPAAEPRRRGWAPSAPAGAACCARRGAGGARVRRGRAGGGPVRRRRTPRRPS